MSRDRHPVMLAPGRTMPGERVSYPRLHIPELAPTERGAVSATVAMTPEPLADFVLALDGVVSSRGQSPQDLDEAAGWGDDDA